MEMNYGGDILGRPGTWRKRPLQRKRRRGRAESRNLMFVNWVPGIELGTCHSLQQGPPRGITKLISQMEVLSLRVF